MSYPKMENMKITAEMRAQLKDFYGNYATEEETAKIIQKTV